MDTKYKHFQPIVKWEMMRQVRYMWASYNLRKVRCTWTWCTDSNSRVTCINYTWKVLSIRSWIRAQSHVVQLVRVTHESRWTHHFL